MTQKILNSDIYCIYVLRDKEGQLWWNITFDLSKDLGQKEQIEYLKGSILLYKEYHIDTMSAVERLAELQMLTAVELEKLIKN